MGRKPGIPQPRSTPWELRLYVADWEPRSAETWFRLNQLCEEYVPGVYKIEVIDLHKEPRRSQQDQIVALPTVVRGRPLPEKRTIGRLTETDKVVAALGFRAAPQCGRAARREQRVSRSEIRQ